MVNYGKFGQGIAQALNNKCVGYEIAIFNGLDLEWSDSKGLSVVDPPVTITSRTRMGVLSMSKTITATAVIGQIARMADNGMAITPDSLIHPYLPSNWQRGANVDKLTFRNLLNHSSGLLPVTVAGDGDPDLWENLQLTIGLGASAYPHGVYQNCNYTLFRIILPYMVRGAAHYKSYEADGASGALPHLVGMEYQNIVIDRILTPSNVTGVSVNPSGPTPYTLFYKMNDTSQTWQDGPNGDAVLRTGAGYWNMSTREYGRFIANLTHGKLFSMSHYKWMYENVSPPASGGAGAGLGIWVFPGQHGYYLGHNGGLTVSNGAGAYGGWMAFPDGTSAVFLANSDNISGKEPEFNILMPAYDAAVS